MTPFFSVVVPVYNRADKLGAALESVFAQTEQDFEIVVVDDGSTDRPETIVERFADPRLNFVRQDNKGGGAARNAGIDRARGAFVAFLDSDDVFLPGHLATMRLLVENRENTAGYARMIVDRGDGRTFLKPPRAILPGEHMATYLMRDRGFVPTITLVVPHEIAARVRYDETLAFAEDMDFALRLFLAGCRFAMAEEPGAIWRDLPDPDRTSAGRKGIRLVGWLEKMKRDIPAKAYFGAKGWMIAKGVASENSPEALKLYLSALLRGCYRPRLAAVIFLQIFMPDALYRKLADRMIGLLRGAVWSRGERGSAAPRR